MALPTRLVAAAVALAVVLAGAGLLREFTRFGLTDAATSARLEEDVRAIIAERSGEVEGLARRVALEGALISAAAESRDRLPALFDRLVTIAKPVDQHGVAVTIYVPGGPGVPYQVLAWSDGPGEQNLATARLSGPAAIFLAPGHAGMRLVFVDPVEYGGRRIAVAVAETVIATTTAPAAGPTSDRYLATSFGPVSVIEQFASARDELTAPNGFVVTTSTGEPLLEVHVTASDLHARRLAFRRVALALAALPLVMAVLLLALLIVRHRRHARAASLWLAWTGLAVAAIVIAALALGLLMHLAAFPGNARDVVVAACAWAVATLGPGAWWWRRGHPRAWRVSWLFLLEHVAAGAGLAVSVEATARLINWLVTPAMIDEGQSVLFPFDLGGLLSLGTLLVAELAVSWTVASLLASLALRWRLSFRRPAALVAAACWLLPVGLVLLSPGSVARQAPVATWTMAAAACVFALAAGWSRRRYRRSAQATRLLLAFACVALPLLVLYPVAAATTDRLTRGLIEDDYAPAAAHHPQDLRDALTRARREIDNIRTLPDLVSTLPSSDTQAAFLVWNQTGLAQARVISDVELYGRDRGLVSRFALNLPEYVYRTSLQTWQGRGCAWEVFGEVTPFGAEERLMLHAERGVCDANGQLIGGIVVHVASNDYQALPFVSSQSPYADVIGTPENGSRLPDLTMAVYGWGLQPLFASRPVPWAVDAATFDRLYNPGTPFWASVPTSDGDYRVYFSQNRAGVYAFGYPAPTMVAHATRLAEIAALAAMLFVVLQAAMVLYAPLTRTPAPPVRVLLHEIRSSFYRKLFLFFVAAAVVPVLASALAFGGYMTSRFRADVENEAAGTVTVARRVFEELLAASGRDTGSQKPPPDDVMVWIRQVINQDVNLYDGSELSATSQRDLFDSGLLPTRTPAAVYRAVALEGRPTFLADDSIGAFQYLVAATPVVARGRDSILTVPLAPRQREIAQEIDVLYRRVLVGVVFVVLCAAVLGASLASRVADPVARLTRATRRIAAGRLDTRVDVQRSDELGRLVDDFNSMAGTLEAQRAELARANQLKAWNEMARQVAHEIKNPLTPIQLAAEHLRAVHTDRQRPLGALLDRCVDTILGQVRLLRQIASEFSTFAAEPPIRREPLALGALLSSIVDPYRVGLADRVTIDLQIAADLPPVDADRTLLSRALTNLVENAIQAMPSGGRLTVRAASVGAQVVVEVADTGIGMDEVALARAFQPYFSTKTGGSGLGLANAKRHVERHGGTIAIASAPGRGTTITLVLPRAADLRG